MKFSTFTSVIALNLFVMGSAMAMMEDTGNTPLPKYAFTKQKVDLTAVFEGTVTQSGKSIDVVTKEGTGEYHLMGKIDTNGAPCVRVSYDVELEENSGFAIGFLTEDQSAWMQNVGFDTPGAHRNTIEIEDPTQKAVWLVFTNNLAKAGISKFKIHNFSVEVGRDAEDLLTASIIAAQSPDDYKVMMKALRPTATQEDKDNAEKLRAKLLARAIDKDQEKQAQLATPKQKQTASLFWKVVTLGFAQ
jgi:hypothetical protein